MAIEHAAYKHGIPGPAASSNASPLDGPFAGFHRTPANENAYYMHLAIMCVAAAMRARTEVEKREGEEERNGQRSCKRNSGEGADGARVSASAGALARAAPDREARITSAVEAAMMVASSSATLFTVGEIGREEKILMAGLAAFKSQQKGEALRWVWEGVVFKGSHRQRKLRSVSREKQCWGTLVRAGPASD